MKLSDAEVRELVEKGCSLHDRLNGTFVPVRDDSSPLDAETERSIDARIKEWMKAAADDDGEAFGRRLAFSGLTLAGVRPCLGKVRLPHSARLPYWAYLLNPILDYSFRFPFVGIEELDYEQYPFLRAENPIPFEEVLLPSISFAENELSRLYGEKVGQVSEKVLVELKRHLITRLSDASARVFEIEFGAFLAIRQLRGTPEDRRLQVKQSRSQYILFVKRMLGGGAGQHLQGVRSSCGIATAIYHPVGY